MYTLDVEDPVYLLGVLEMSLSESPMISPSFLAIAALGKIPSVSCKPCPLQGVVGVVVPCKWLYTYACIKCNLHPHTCPSWNPAARDACLPELS